jgi:hypothetical protein
VYLWRVSGDELRKCAAKLSEAEDYDLIISQRSQLNTSARGMQSHSVFNNQINGESTSTVINNSTLTDTENVALGFGNNAADQCIITEDTECYDYELLVNTKSREFLFVGNADDDCSPGLSTGEASECARDRPSMTETDRICIDEKSDNPNAARADSTIEESICRFNFVVPVTPVRKSKAIKSTESQHSGIKQSQSEDLHSSRMCSSICDETALSQHSPRHVRGLSSCTRNCTPEEIDSHSCHVISYSSDSALTDSDLTTVGDTLPLLSQQLNSSIPANTDELPVDYAQVEATCDSKLHVASLKGHTRIGSAQSNLQSVLIGQKALGIAGRSSQKLQAPIDQDLNSSGMHKYILFINASAAFYCCFSFSLIFGKIRLFQFGWCI